MIRLHDSCWLRLRATILSCLFALCAAQGQSIHNMQLLGRWDDDTLPVVSPNNLRYTYSGCWGMAINQHELAIVGGARSVLFFDVTAPQTPRLIDKFYGNSTALREVKSYRDRIYVTAGGGSDGLMIFDMSQAPDTIIQTYWSNEFFKYSHTITIDTSAGRIYLNGSDAQNGGVVVLDIRQNPDKPVLLSKVNLAGGYVHDAYVRRDTFYVSSGYEGFYVFDFHDATQPKLLAQVSTGGYNHYSGLTNDSRYAYYVEEIPQGRPIQIVDLQQLSMNEIEVAGHVLDNLLPGGGALAIPHNLFIKDSLLLVSQYEDGMLVYDISMPLEPRLIAWYDTHPENVVYNGYFGNWGNYPWLPSGNIITVDMQNGLFMLKLDNSTAVQNPHAATPLHAGIFPNPATGPLYIRLEQPANWQLRLLDLQGRTMLTQTGLQAAQHRLELGALPAGMYLLEISDDHGVKQLHRIAKSN